MVLLMEGWPILVFSSYILEGWLVLHLCSVVLSEEWLTLVCVQLYCGTAGPGWLVFSSIAGQLA